MLRIEKGINTQGKHILNKAISYFGADGLGLKMTENSDCCVHFVGGGGHVRVLIHEEPDNGCRVAVESREWDYHAKKFLQEV